jgi:CheY-like chemotaxis protein
METGGRANIHYLRSGVVCDVFLPASSIAPGETRASHRTIDEPLAIAPVARRASDAFRILVVEDSFLLVTLIEDMFDDFGWKVVGPASTKAEALLMVECEMFDAALLDINLDGEMSWDVAVAIKDRGIPFVFSTGYDTATLLPDYLAGSLVLGKPFRRNQLEQRLREAIVGPKTQHS